MERPMLIFDLDGTLWDSSAQVAESWNIVFARRGIPRELTAADIRAVMGKTMDEIARIMMPETAAPQRSEIFRECETFEIDYIREHGGILFPQVRETLNALTEAGYALAIVSNCQTGYIGAFLTSMKLEGSFCDTEEWGNTMRPKADNIRLVMERGGSLQAIYIGDTEGDRLAAEGAGVRFVHAAYGFGAVPEAEYVLPAFSELPRLLKEWDISG